MKFLPAFFLSFVVATNSLLAQTNFAPQPAPEWDKLFQRTNGWIGADGDYSVRLSDDKILWLFSDTWVGEVKHGKRVNPRMINNSIGVQHGTNPATASVDFFYRTNAEKQATAFFLPENGRGYFWPFAGVRTSKGLFIFLQNVENYKAGTPFGFRTFDTVLGHVTNPDDEPLKWKITQRKIPFAKFASDERLMVGGAILHEKPFVYIYATLTQTHKNHQSELVIIRVHEDALDNFDEWKFFIKKGWRKTPRDLQSLASKTSSEFSVSWQAALKKYVLVQSDGIFGRIKISLSEKPEGPWSEPKMIYQTPEGKWPGVFCYAGKAHPGLAQNPDELVISYAANAWNFLQVIDDARLYWPRFVTVPLKNLGE